MEQRLLMDLIVGCFLQFLNCDPRAMSKVISKNAKKKFLHSLNNYCSLQRIVEDQFGLDLVTRTLHRRNASGSNRRSQTWAKP